VETNAIMEIVMDDLISMDDDDTYEEFQPPTKLKPLT
jgi:hypothetical protein